MRKHINIFVKKSFLFIVFIFISFSISAQKISIGASCGLLSVDKNNGINGNLFGAYHLNDKISFGADALFANGESDLKTNAYIAYIEVGNPIWSLDNKNLIYFSGILGLGQVEQKIDSYKMNEFTFYAGTKININLSTKFLFGIKSGIYMSKLEKDPIMANLFFTYKL